MTREIKFRAWHTGLKQMFSAEEMSSDQLALLPDGRFCNVHGSDTSKSTFPPMIPLQYTGLQAKNGKKIWEADLMTTAYKTVGEVVFYRDSWYVYAKVPVMPGLEEYAYVSIFSCEDLVGNKFENPELLTK